jgi:hypothetical protein
VYGLLRLLVGIRQLDEVVGINVALQASMWLPVIDR